jgi:hypothetical protein
MREYRSSGSVEGVVSDHDSYSDFVNALHVGTASLVFRHKLHSSLFRTIKLTAAQLGSVLLSSTRMHSSRP